MTLESQVVSLALAQKLKELGVKQESLFHWMEHTKKKTGETVWALDGFGEWCANRVGDGRLSGRSWKSDWDTRVSAFTDAELDEWLLHGTSTFKTDPRTAAGRKGKFACERGDETQREYADTGANAKAKMLIYLVENKLITV